MTVLCTSNPTRAALKAKVVCLPSTTNVSNCKFKKKKKTFVNNVSTILL